MGAPVGVTTFLAEEAVVPALLFVAAYACLQPWWRSVVGRHMMAFMFGCTVVLALVDLSAILGMHYPGRDWVRFGAWVVINVIFWWRLVILVRVLRQQIIPPIDESDIKRERPEESDKDID